jgi:hypothetical protein
MSITDEFANLEQRVRARLTELRPLAQEYRELEELARRLGINGEASTKRASAAPLRAAAAPSKKTAAPDTRRRGRPTRAKAPGAATARTASSRGTAETAEGAAKAQPTAAGRARSIKAAGRRRAATSRAGTRRKDLLALVKQRPGITVRQAAEDMGVDATSLYRVVRQLEQSGQVTKKGRELQPA